jgi:hypothetical protein
MEDGVRRIGGRLHMYIWIATLAPRFPGPLLHPHGYQRSKPIQKTPCWTGSCSRSIAPTTVPRHAG